MQDATIRFDKKKTHTTTKYENAQASLYLEFLRGNDNNEMLYTMEERETWTFGGDYEKVKHEMEPHQYWEL